MNMRMIFGTIAVAVALAGCVSGPKVDNAPMTALFFAPAGALVWAGESLVLAPVWDMLCLPVDFYRRDEYLKKDIWQ